MIRIENKNDEISLSFPQYFVSSQYLQSVIERLELEAAAEKSTLSQADAWNLAEDMKAEWWKENKDSILNKIKR